MGRGQRPHQSKTYQLELQLGPSAHVGVGLERGRDAAPDGRGVHGGGGRQSAGRCGRGGGRSLSASAEADARTDTRGISAAVCYGVIVFPSSGVGGLAVACLVVNVVFIGGGDSSMP